MTTRGFFSHNSPNTCFIRMRTCIIRIRTCTDRVLALALCLILTIATEGLTCANLINNLRENRELHVLLRNTPTCVLSRQSLSAQCLATFRMSRFSTWFSCRVKPMPSPWLTPSGLYNILNRTTRNLSFVQVVTSGFRLVKVSGWTLFLERVPLHTWIPGNEGAGSLSAGARNQGALVFVPPLFKAPKIILKHIMTQDSDPDVARGCRLVHVNV